MLVPGGKRNRYLRGMKKILLFIALFAIAGAMDAQTTTTPPFRKEIDAFRRKDSLEKPAPNSILFTGSSSFTKWTDVKDYFPGYPIVNRAFGGSQLVDMIRYVDEAVIAYRPKQIVIYCGENDVAASDTVTAQLVLDRFKTLFSLIRKKLPNVQIAFVSLKPSPSRWKLEPIYVEANKRIKDFIGKQKKATFINIHDAMLKPNGEVMTDIFLADNLHMNANGYKIWQPILKPYLLK